MLTKTEGPALEPRQIGPVNGVLLSHDQHPDNLDHAGREYHDVVDEQPHRIGAPIQAACVPVAAIVLRVRFGVAYAKGCR